MVEWFFELTRCVRVYHLVLFGLRCPHCPQEVRITVIFVSPNAKIFFSVGFENRNLRYKLSLSVTLSFKSIRTLLLFDKFVEK